MSKKKSRLSDLNKQLHEPAETVAKAGKKHKAEKAEIESNIPRGQRGDFLKLTITMSGEMLVALKTVGMNRKAEGAKDCDTSALIREAVSEWIKNQ